MGNSKEINAVTTELVKDYRIYIPTRMCCKFVNRNRYNVERIVFVKNGEPVKAECSFCGSEMPVPENIDILEDGFIEINGKPTDFNKISRILFKGRVAVGHPHGVMEYEK